MAPEDDSEIPGDGAVFTFGKSKFAENIPNKFWVRNDKVILTACGDEHTALVAESGRIFTFGANDWGQLGLGHTNATTKPSCIKSLKHENVKLVACGRAHTIVATESGFLYAFGANGENQLGVDDTPGSNDPKCLDTLECTQYSMLSAGADHSAALTEDGRVFVWGSGSEGQLGLKSETECPKPKQLPFDKFVTCISCGYYHSALVTDDGYLYTFGEVEGGKLGLGEDPEEYDTPQHVTAIKERVKWVSCGGSHTVAVTEKGRVYTFGNGANGQLGQGTSMLELSIPHLLTSVEGRVVFSSCGENHTALITDRGQLYTFGDGRHGKLGLGMESFANQFKPCKVKRFDKLFVEKVACGGCHMLALGYPRQQNGEQDSEEEDEGETEVKKSLMIDSINNNNHMSLDLNGSISARDRRRQVSPMPSFNRTLPTLSSMKGVPSLNSTLPAVQTKDQSADPLTRSLLPRIHISKENGLKRQEKTETLESDDEDEEDEDEGRQPVEEIVKKQARVDVHSEPPKAVPRPVPRTKIQHKRDSEDDGMESDEDDRSDMDTVEAPIPSPRSKKDKDKEDSEEDDKDDEESEKESDKQKKGKDKDKKDKDKKKDKDVKKEKKKSRGIFGRKKVESEDEEEEDDGEEVDEEEELEEISDKKKDKKDKDKKKDKKGKSKDKKDKDKKGKKDTKKDKDGSEDEEEEEEDSEDKGKKGKDLKKDKKKDKDKGKDKKKDKEKKKDKDEEKKSGNEDDEEVLTKTDEGKDVDDKDKTAEDNDNHENEDDDKDKTDSDDKTKEEEKKPTKKSRTCTVL